MQYRPLGKTDLNVSVLSYGASSLGSVFYEIDEAEGIRTVHTALNLGINFIDVSPYYGLTKAETVLGKALVTVPRDSYYLSTKVGRYGGNDFDFSAERVTKSVEESLGRLGIETIDLILCHDVEFGSLSHIVEETVPALRRLQAQGKVRFVGISGYPLKIFRIVAEQTPLDAVLSYCRYTLHDTGLESLIPFVQEKQIGLISASPLSMGLLTERGAPDWHPASQSLKAACAQAAAHCRAQGVDIAQLALQFALTNTNISTTLVGTAEPDLMRKNVEWMASPLDMELLAEVQEILRPVHNQTWPSGRPENQDEAR